MANKEKEAKIKEMELFLKKGVPEEARDREYDWENEPEIHIYAIEPKQRVNENDEKAIEVGNSKDAKPVPSEDAIIKAIDDEQKKTKGGKSKREKTDR